MGRGLISAVLRPLATPFAMLGLCSRLLWLFLGAPLSLLRLPLHAALYLLGCVNAPLYHLLVCMVHPPRQAASLEAEAALAKAHARAAKYKGLAQDLQARLDGASDSHRQLQQRHREARRRVSELEAELQQLQASRGQRQREEAAPPPQQEQQEQQGQDGATARRRHDESGASSWRMHGAALACAAAVHLYCRIEQDPLQQKLMMVAAWPMAWMYAAVLLGCVPPSARLRQLVAALCCALLGYVGHELVHVHLAHGAGGALQSCAGWQAE